MSQTGEAISPEQSRSLLRWNLAAGALHLVQGTAILILASDAALPVFASWADGPPATANIQQGEPIFELAFGPAIAAFLYLAAIDHFAVAAPRIRGWYERNLAKGINYARWAEFSISASLMMILIAMLAGIRELTALIAIFGVNAAMIMTGLFMERSSRPGRDVDWSPFAAGSVIGSIPWIVIGFELARAESQTGMVPGFVVVIFFSLLVWFSLFPLNMYLQYKQVGRWSDYLFGERGYIVLSLTAKSLLAWQVFAGALTPS